MKWLFLLLSTLTASAQFTIGSPFYVASFLKPAAVGGGYDPSADSTVVRWLRVEGTTGTNASNSSITNLQERAGGNHFSNLTALASGPIISNNFLNGKAVMFGFGTNWLESADGQYSGVTAAHYFIMCKASVDDGTTLNGFWRFGGSDAQLVYYPFGTDIYSSLGSTTRHNGNPTADISQWHLLEIVSVAGEWTLYIDGAQQFTDASNTVGFGGSVEILMSNQNTESTGWVGAVAEIIMRDTRAAGGTLTDIRAYFTSEYGVP